MGRLGPNCHSKHKPRNLVFSPKSCPNCPVMVRIDVNTSFQSHISVQMTPDLHPLFGPCKFPTATSEVPLAATQPASQLTLCCLSVWITIPLPVHLVDCECRKHPFPASILLWQYFRRPTCQSAGCMLPYWPDHNSSPNVSSSSSSHEWDTTSGCADTKAWDPGFIVDETFAEMTALSIWQTVSNGPAGSKRQ